MSNYYPEQRAPERARGLRARVAAWLHKEQQVAAHSPEQKERSAGDDGAHVENHEPPMPSH